VAGGPNRQTPVQSITPDIAAARSRSRL
jgi:hypothetical protein